MSSHPLLQALLEFGFEKIKAEKALEATAYKGVSEAIDWMIAHDTDSNTSNADIGQTTEVKSEEVLMTSEVLDKTKDQPSTSSKIETKTRRVNKCQICNKICGSFKELQDHATKTGHDNFAEVVITDEDSKTAVQVDDKPKMTEAEMQEKIKERRQKREEEEKKLAIERELLRRKEGQSLQAIKEAIEEKEMKKLVEDRKREKKEDDLARKRVLDAIKQDRESKQRENQSIMMTSQQPSPQLVKQAPPPHVQEPTKMSYDTCKLQIRLPNGKTLIETFKAKEPLSVVRLYVELNRTDDEHVPFSLVQNLPRKIFSDEDMEASLESLDLVPSAVLVVQRQQVI